MLCNHNTPEMDEGAMRGMERLDHITTSTSRIKVMARARITEVVGETSEGEEEDDAF